MICFIALIVFAVLGIFSARYRAYFFEALDCVFRKATLRKCTSSFDKKMKVKVSSGFARLSKPLGGFVFKNFEVLSLIVTIAMIISLVWSAVVGGVALYNWVSYGNCDGPDSGAICTLNQLTGKDPVNGSVISSSGGVNPACDLNSSKWS